MVHHMDLISAIARLCFSSKPALGHYNTISSIVRTTLCTSTLFAAGTGLFTSEHTSMSDFSPQSSGRDGLMGGTSGDLIDYRWWNCDRRFFPLMCFHFNEVNDGLVRFFFLGRGGPIIETIGANRNPPIDWDKGLCHTTCQNV